jgi:hypothetical protein
MRNPELTYTQCIPKGEREPHTLTIDEIFFGHIVG